MANLALTALVLERAGLRHAGGFGDPVEDEDADCSPAQLEGALSALGAIGAIGPGDAERWRDRHVRAGMDRRTGRPMPAEIRSRVLERRQVGQPAQAVAISWSAQRRLHRLWARMEQRLVAALRPRLRPSDALFEAGDKQLMVVCRDTGREVGNGLAADVERVLDRLEPGDGSGSRVRSATAETPIDLDALLGRSGAGSGRDPAVERSSGSR